MTCNRNRAEINELGIYFFPSETRNTSSFFHSQRRRQNRAATSLLLFRLLANTLPPVYLLVMRRNASLAAKYANVRPGPIVMPGPG